MSSISSTDTNYNKVIGESTEQATEIGIRVEIDEESGIGAGDIWKKHKDKFRSFARSTNVIGEKFAFAKYQYDIMCLMGKMLDELSNASPVKSK